ncbi:hypothetical protein LP420_33155 [Massilia sp. B-10]|nr:hypothetical protein LP420_33155 [Massilia sp. B-10]
MGVDQGEGFDVVDKGPHAQAAPVHIGRQAAAQAERIGAGLLLADAPALAVGALLKVIDQG